MGPGAAMEGYRAESHFLLPGFEFWTIIYMFDGTGFETQYEKENTFSSL
jgi:hypothetical protein